jgi:hypothetical protein
MRAEGMKPREAVKHRKVVQPKREHSVPWFWPYAAAIELGDEGLDLFEVDGSWRSLDKIGKPWSGMR